MATFAQRLQKLRKGKQQTQEQMAQMCSMSARGYQNYEIGKSTPNYRTLLLLADYFDVSLDYLVGRSDNPQRQ